jgi:hypothetical protein
VYTVFCKQRTETNAVPLSCYVPVLLYNAAKQVFYVLRFAAFVIKRSLVMIVTVTCCFVTLLNKNSLFKYCFGFPVILKRNFELQ